MKKGLPLLACFLLFLTLQAHALGVPDLRGYVNDYANMITNPTNTLFVFDIYVLVFIVHYYYLYISIPHYYKLYVRIMSCTSGLAVLPEFDSTIAL